MSRRKDGWTGSVVRAARRYWGARLREAEGAGSPLRCYRRYQPVLFTDPWDVEHIQAREDGGSVRALNNQWVSHGSCNRADGAARTNAKRVTKAKGLWQW